MPLTTTAESKQALYRQASRKILAMLDGETDEVARMATVAAILAGTFEAFYWAGFYRLVDGELVIGPYQGTPGCLRIAMDRGVCGAAASKRETLIVPDTSAFPGHIACDVRSRSEIVVPVMDSFGNLMAVLDIDSESLATFDETDQQGLEQIISAVFSENE